MSTSQWSQGSTSVCRLDPLGTMNVCWKCNCSYTNWFRRSPKNWSFDIMVAKEDKSGNHKIGCALSSREHEHVFIKCHYNLSNRCESQRSILTPPCQRNWEYWGMCWIRGRWEKKAHRSQHIHNSPAGCVAALTVTERGGNTQPLAFTREQVALCTKGCGE